MIIALDYKLHKEKRKKSGFHGEAKTGQFYYTPQTFGVINKNIDNKIKNI